ncbi:hypothetical protein M413DRAFT_14585 [Hebeloma cylindrosporum]|uniref:Uncharacterized protein n=1 Tax=Hebeloma cylindrosporum TaxID=76867 RepID=A0A0C3BVD5_HEBCY|nr:hypothetical protein M413DRAFT_14585 [Hebeloma cylindrosporum h7]
MFSSFKVVLSFLLVATTVRAAPAAPQGSIIHVQRDMTKDPFRQNVQDFGCIVTRLPENPDVIPWVAVSGYATDSECARFEITREGDFSPSGNKFRFKELSTGKLMVHRGDWIWLDSGPLPIGHEQLPPSSKVCTNVNYLTTSRSTSGLRYSPSASGSALFSISRVLTTSRFCSGAYICAIFATP